MKQVQMHAYGAAEILQVVEMPIPRAGGGELLIQVEAVGVNFSDVLRRQNRYFMPTPLPYVLGVEAVGTVAGIGNGVDATATPIGTRVLAILPESGGYAEYVTAPAHFCIPMPPHVDPAQATALFVQGTTAYLILHAVAGDVQGKRVLVHAAAGGVGSLLVQLAKQAGAHVTATASTDEKLALSTALGADCAVNYSEADWPAQVIAATDGEKVDLILEMVGGDVFVQSFQCLKAGGAMIVYGAASGQKGMIHSEHFVDESQSLYSFNLAHFIQHRPEAFQAALGALIGMLAQGALAVQINHRFALDDVVNAHRQLENRQTTGKVVLIP